MALGHHTEALASLEACILLSQAGTSGRDDAVAQLPRVLARLEQSHGMFDMRTVVPMLESPAERDAVEDYIGPLEVRSTGEMGRGTFTTEAVKKGQLLLAEKAVACALPREDRMGLTFDCVQKRVSKESSEAVAAAALQAGASSRHIQARLGFLYDGTVASMAVPDMKLLRSGVEAARHPSEALSIARMRRVVKYNAFQVGVDDGGVEKLAAVVEEGKTYMQDYAIEDFMQKCDEAGTGLFVVASFMNHAAQPNIYREFIGRMLFIYADRDMPEGTELFNWYGENVDDFMCGWDGDPG
jgi:hypothetical protein